MFPSAHRPPKMVAGPYTALAPSGSVTDVVPPPSGQVTEGEDAVSGAVAACPNPYLVYGPPKRLTFVK